MKNIKARDIMTTKVLTVTPETSVKALAHFLLKHQISGAPVLDQNGRLTGIATEGDLIFRNTAVHLPTVITIFDAVIYLESPHKYEPELQKIIGGKVGDIMTREVISLSPDASLQEIATIMHEKKRHLLPVIDNDNLVGIVGKADMVRAIAKEE